MRKLYRIYDDSGYQVGSVISKNSEAALRRFRCRRDGEWKHEDLTVEPNDQSNTTNDENLKGLPND